MAGVVGSETSVDGAKVLRNDSKECTTEGNAENNDNSDKNWMRFFFHVIYIVAELAENS